MKKTLLLILLLAACFAISNAGQVTRTEDFSANTLSIEVSSINGTYFSVVNCDNLPSGSEDSAPVLPRKFVSLVLPANSGNIIVKNISKTHSQPVQLLYPVIPQPDTQTTDYHNHAVYKCNPEIYDGTALYPAPIVSVIGVEDYYGMNTIVTLQITPMQYSPSANELDIFSNVTYTIEYGDVEPDKDCFHLWRKFNLRERESAYEYISQMVANPEALNKADYTAEPITPYFIISKSDNVGGITVYPYSIITNKELSKAFERMASLKRQTGIEAGVILIEDILSNPLVQCGDVVSNINDDAGKLRHFLTLAAQQTELKYVLLGGNSSIVPIRYASVHAYKEIPSNISQDDIEYSQVPSDWYYAKYERNWNVDGDKYYGELKEKVSTTRNMYASYLYIGRTPCTTAEDVNNFIDKLEFYVLNPGKGDYSYLNTAFSHFSQEVDSLWPKEEYRSNSYIGWSFSNHIINHLKGDTLVLGRDVIRHINESKCALIDMHCHGMACNLSGDPQMMLWRGIPEKVDSCDVYRNDLNLRIYHCGDYGGYANCEYVVVEPDGSMHRDYMLQANTLNDISPNSTVTIIKENCVPFVCDLAIQNQVFTGYHYTYAKNASLGKDVHNSKYSAIGNVEFANGCEYVLDAFGDVTLSKGTVVKNGAKVKIFSPGTCFIDSLIVEAGGLIEIHANRLRGYNSIVSESIANNVKLFGYDKYGLGNEPDLIIESPANKASRSADSYTPLVEDGKEWRYTIHDNRHFVLIHERDVLFKFRIEGKTMIDGKEYHPVYTYTGDMTTPDIDVPIAYLREDIESKKVYALWNPEYLNTMPKNDTCAIYLVEFFYRGYTDEEILLYDFTFPNESESNICEIECKDGIHRGCLVWNDVIAYFEGLGWIGHPDSVNCPFGYWNRWDLFGHMDATTGGRERYHNLYAIVAPDGTEIYTNELNRPDSYYPEEYTYPDQVGIEQIGDDSDGGKVEYFNLQGMPVANPEPGTLCIRRQGGTVEKVVVR